MRRHPARAALAGMLLLLAAGCGDATEPSPSLPEGIDLGVAWQPVPITISPEILAAAEAACRAGGGVARRDVPLVVVDARGANRALLVFAGPDQEGDCFVFRTDAGRLVMDGGGSAEGDGLVPPEATGLSIMTVGSFGGGIEPDELGGDRGYVIGRAGVAVAAVQIELANGARLQASIGPTGWFAAWWPANVEFRRAQGFDAAGAPVGVAQ